MPACSMIDCDCERSKVIQSSRRRLWIASSASPPRNDESMIAQVSIIQESGIGEFASHINELVRLNEQPTKERPGGACWLRPDAGCATADCYRLNFSQPPSPCCGVRAATGPTIRSKSAFEPGLPWIGTCVATSSLSRLRLRYSTTALLLTFARLPPAGGGP